MTGCERRPGDAKEQKWDRKDLARRLCHALDIAKHTVERLGSTGYSDSVEPSNSVPPEKLVSETAFLLVAASAADCGADVRLRIRDVAELLMPHARSERVLLAVCLEPALALDYAQAHVCLTRLGYQDDGFDTVLRRSVSSQARAGRERPPHRMLEQEWIESNWTASGPHPRRPSASTAALVSVLNRPMDLLNGNRDDVYAFTHAVMYVTDFNIRPRRLPRPRAVILAEAEAALARCLDEQDYDLGGEVLLAWPLTGKSWSPAAAFGFRVLARVEDEAGFLPAPITRLQRLNALQGSDRTNYLLATAYHTACVMGLLSAAALQPGRTPPSEVARAVVAPGSATLILQLLETDSTRPHWRDELDLLDESQRDAVGSLLLNIALRRKIRAREFETVHKLLELSYSLGLADLPAASQAAEMLERLSIFARITEGRGRTTIAER